MIWTDLLRNTWALSLEAAPWLLLGLLMAGLLQAYLPAKHLQRWLGGPGIGSVLRAAVVGAPLPLCSCGVIPAAVALHRQGANRGATVSFLVATPETGVDSVALSYALLGPFMTIVRPIAAILSAIVAGLVAQGVPVRVPLAVAGAGGEASGCGCSEPVSADPCCGGNDATDCCETGASTSCCESEASSDCCGSSCGGSGEGEAAGGMARLVGGLRFAAADLIDDLGVWLLVGLILAGVAATFIPPETMETWGSGLPAMGLMLLVGVPMYICATASTPLAAALLLAGVSPGTVLVFLLAGPATNLATLGVVRREMGTAVAASYVAAISVSAVVLGLLTDLIVSRLALDVRAQSVEADGWMPYWLAVGSLVVLVVLAIRPLRRRLIGR